MAWPNRKTEHVYVGVHLNFAGGVSAKSLHSHKDFNLDCLKHSSRFKQQAQRVETSKLSRSLIPTESRMNASPNLATNTILVLNDCRAEKPLLLVSSSGYYRVLGRGREVTIRLEELLESVLRPVMTVDS